MIKKIIKGLTNPKGALVQAVIKILIKQFNLDKLEENISKALKYVEEPNEIDLGLKALKDMVVSQEKELLELRKLIKKGKK